MERQEFDRFNFQNLLEDYVREMEELGNKESIYDIQPKNLNLSLSSVTVTYKVRKQRSFPDGFKYVELEKSILICFLDLLGFLHYSINRSFHYEGWYCRWDKKDHLFYLFTPDNLDMAPDNGYADTECSTVQQCKNHIDWFINNDLEG